MLRRFFTPTRIRSARQSDDCNRSAKPAQTASTPPGPSDPATLRTIVREAGGPVNALIGLGSTLTMTDAAAIGIRRVSVGGSLYRATMATFHDLVHQLVDTGTFGADPPALPDAGLKQAFAHSRTAAG